MTGRSEFQDWTRAETHELATIEVEGYAIVGTPDVETLRFSQTGHELMRLVPVTTPTDLEHLRIIRNECREFMTHNTNEISQEQQVGWWANVSDHPDWKVWLVYVPGWIEPVGFAMLRRAVTRWYATLGLRAWMRGQGYGTLIYRGLRDLAPTDAVWAAIRDDNTASIRAAEKAGYVRGDWTIEGQIALVGRRQT